MWRDDAELRDREYSLELQMRREARKEGKKDAG